MTDRRPKGLTAKQEKEFDVIKKTYSGYGFTNLLTVARLRQPEIFPYAKQNRLHKEVALKIIQSWEDIADIFHYLPESYRKEVISSKAFDSLFTTQIFSTLEEEVRKKRKQRKHKTANISEETLYRLYLNFFRIGYNGLIKLMPNEFQWYLIDQTQPMFNLMRSISQYTKRITKRKAGVKSFNLEKSQVGL